MRLGVAHHLGWAVAVTASAEHRVVVLSTVGPHLSSDKTLITHIDEGLEFLGWRIQRHRKPGTNRRYVYTYLAKKPCGPRW